MAVGQGLLDFLMREKQTEDNNQGRKGLGAVRRSRAWPVNDGQGGGGQAAFHHLAPG
jgi:hypothetical protein